MKYTHTKLSNHLFSQVEVHRHVDEHPSDKDLFQFLHGRRVLVLRRLVLGRSIEEGANEIAKVSQFRQHFFEADLRFLDASLLCLLGEEFDKAPPVENDFWVELVGWDKARVRIEEGEVLYQLVVRHSLKDGLKEKEDNYSYWFTAFFTSDQILSE